MLFITPQFRGSGGPVLGNFLYDLLIDWHAGEVMKFF